ncbi:carboxymuconolactone decarboxylase family protein [Desulfoferrobacter suflitae]|uniref:carboxymuconolactone decarboxylase family protein n=1 Tax=Desulfoferrobacter suflitae TaxID=2865782 RepID=UPI002164B8E0|nr:carboxymuconolactone decarboxylase family protein [Desulfoferrobacter suflitae]MCK8601624.1 carboxymuconolactone decarboxylase family protein [Desulfoferrobacter suflitae]
MAEKKYPEWFTTLKAKHKEFIEAVEDLGKAVRQAGPIDEKQSQLIQLAAAAAIRSEGAVHSHAKRALRAGATADEVYHAIMLLTSTIGFPNVSAALSWASDVVNLAQE